MQAGMIIATVTIVAVGFLPYLPSPGVLALVLFLALVVIFLRRFLLVIPLCFGLLWASVYGYLGLSQQLPEELEGVDVWVEGTVSGLPKVTARSQRFEFDINKVESSEGVYQHLNLQKIRVNWYQRDMLVLPGERWRLLVRLKRPHGFANPGGFDYEGWLFRQGIGATGYVRGDDKSHRIIPPGYRNLLDQWRHKLLAGLSNHLVHNPNKGFLLALLIGERSEIDDEQWQLLSTTGTNHLFVISGLHVGFVALCGYVLFFQLSRLLLLGPPRIAAQQVGAIGALLTSCCYAAIAGFSLPTQRALIMLVVMLLGRLCRRQINVWHSFCLALLLVLLWEPLAAHSPGFWLSFGAVGSLLYAFSHRTDSTGFWWRWIRPQWVVFIAFVPVLLFFFQQASLVSPLANILAIPVVGFVIVPLCLLVVMLQILAELSNAVIFYQAVDGLLKLTSFSLSQVFTYIQWLAEMPWAKWTHVISLWSLLPALAGVLLLLAPPGLPARWLGWFCFLPLFTGIETAPDSGGFEVAVLDVGQGLAVVVRTENYQLLYDTGARFSKSFDAASAVVLPYLRQQGVNQLDKLVISHGDNDHAGALPQLLENIEVSEIISGASATKTIGLEALACEGGKSWRWDGVHFELMRAERNVWDNENNRSCVLMIRSEQMAVLVSGDIETAGEVSLIRHYGDGLRADVLLAPHHGSKTSSSENFLDAVRPEIVIFSSGYRNRFGHPHPKVVARYRQREIEMLNTSEVGAVRIFANPEIPLLEIEKYRESFPRYWF